MPNSIAPSPSKSTYLRNPDGDTMNPDSRLIPRVASLPLAARKRLIRPGAGWSIEPGGLVAGPFEDPADAVPESAFSSLDALLEAGGCWWPADSATWLDAATPARPAGGWTRREGLYRLPGKVSWFVNPIACAIDALGQAPKPGAGEPQPTHTPTHVLTMPRLPCGHPIGCAAPDGSGCLWCAEVTTWKAVNAEILAAAEEVERQAAELRRDLEKERGRIERVAGYLREDARKMDAAAAMAPETDTGRVFGGMASGYSVAADVLSHLDAATRPEPPPAPGDGDVWAEVIATLADDDPIRPLCEARRALGIEWYGCPLHRGDGRDHETDLLQELLDAAVYAQAAGFPRLRDDLLRHLRAVVGGVANGKNEVRNA